MWVFVFAGYYNNGYDTYQSGYGGAGDCPPAGYGSYGRLSYGVQPLLGSGYRSVGSRGGGVGGGSGTGGRGGFGMGVGGGQGASRGKRPFIGGAISRRNVYESQTGHSVHMRGLPYSATEDDIAQVSFVPFAPYGLRGCKNRPAPFPGRMSYRATKPGSICPVS